MGTQRAPLPVIVAAGAVQPVPEYGISVHEAVVDLSEQLSR